MKLQPNQAGISFTVADVSLFSRLFVQSADAFRMYLTGELNDGGITVELKHSEKTGRLFLVFTFTDDKFAHAFMANWKTYFSVSGLDRFMEDLKLVTSLADLSDDLTRV